MLKQTPYNIPTMMSREKDIKRLLIYLLVFMVLNQANQ